MHRSLNKNITLKHHLFHLFVDIKISYWFFYNKKAFIKTLYNTENQTRYNIKDDLFGKSPSHILYKLRSALNKRGDFSSRPYNLPITYTLSFVELRGVEPLTSWMPFKRSPNWATAPWMIKYNIYPFLCQLPIHVSLSNCGSL